MAAQGHVRARLLRLAGGGLQNGHLHREVSVVRADPGGQVAPVERELPRAVDLQIGRGRNHLGLVRYRWHDAHILCKSPRKATDCSPEGNTPPARAWGVHNANVHGALNIPTGSVLGIHSALELHRVGRVHLLHHCDTNLVSREDVFIKGDCLLFHHIARRGPCLDYVIAKERLVRDGHLEQADPMLVKRAGPSLYDEIVGIFDLNYHLLRRCGQ
mmetsp:Transcript_27006/g.58935  ORF Transcript_27006/g.58935 Transcript_27006/m.58935 type:complete len:215 (-) Transcript_27006:545-1189(-)